MCRGTKLCYEENQNLPKISKVSNVYFCTFKRDYNSNISKKLTFDGIVPGSNDLYLFGPRIKKV
jgi:hypothetical protein